MAGNTFGNYFKITSFGESHGMGIGGVIDGCPSGLKIDFKRIQYELNRRKPGQSNIVSPRKEKDKINLFSGIFKGITTGTPIGFVIYNHNYKFNDYDHIINVYRPSHADFTYQNKYGYRDYRGGGRSSARETISRVVAGSIAKQIIKDIKITAFVSSIGDLILKKPYQELNFSYIEKTPIRCPDKYTADKMMIMINKIRQEGNTVGGIITCVIQQVPFGLGYPVFHKLHDNLAKAMLSINAVKGFEYGSGFYGTKMKGNEHNDIWNEHGVTQTNLSGGIQGGISNGMDIYFRVAFKPVATIMKLQKSLTYEGDVTYFEGKGRHDPCVIPRAVPIIESMAALVLVDHCLMKK
jgi:chorismate synthase